MKEMKLIKKIEILGSEWYFEKEEGKWKYTSKNPLGEQRKVEDEDVVQVLDEYLDIVGETVIALDRIDEEEVKILRKWLGWN